VALAVILVGVVLFVGLTRTEVGRNQVREQVETQFNQQFQGSLSIDSLSGTLITNILATGVKLRDPSGRLVGTVETVRATPRWANLLTAELSVQSLSLVRPTLSLRRDSAGTWNVAEALRPTAPSGPPTRSLDLSFADIEVQRGRIETARTGTAPNAVQRGWLFDYTKTTVTDLSFNAVARQSGSNSFLDVDNATFALPGENLRASFFEGQVQKTAEGLSISELDLSLDTTRVRGRASFQTAGREGQPSRVSLDLERSRVDLDEVRRIMPRLPFANVVTVQGGLEGTSEELVANDVTVTHDASFLTLDGRLRPHSEAVQFDARLTESRLYPDDVQSVWPRAPLAPSIDEGPFRMTVSVEGSTTPPGSAPRSFDLASRLAIQSPYGGVQGSIDVARSRTSPLSYDASLTADSLNVGPFGGESVPETQLTGRIDGTGSGSELGTLQGSAELSLSASQVAGRSFASADGTVDVNGDSTEGTLTLRQPEGGRLFVKGSARGLRERPTYTATLTGSNVNLSPLLGPSVPTTQLNTQLTIGGSGIQWRSLTGTAVLNVDTSRVYRGDRTIVLPPHSSTLRLSDRSNDQPRFELSGSVLRLTASGTSLGPSLWTTARTWGTALREMVRRERNKPAPSGPGMPASLSPPADSSSLNPLRRNRPLKARAELEVFQPKIVSAWWPAFPEEADDLTADAELSVGPDSLHTSGRVSATYLRTGPDELEDIEAQYSVSSRIGVPLAQSTTISATVAAHRAALGGPSLLNPSAALTYAGRSGELSVQADSAGIAESLRVSGALNVTPSTNEVRLREASVTIDEKEWTNAGPASVRIYSDGLALTPFVLRQPHPETPSLQEVRVQGALSTRRTDTLTVETTNVYLPPFSQSLNLPHVVGGNLNGEVRLRNPLGRPQLTSDLSMQRLSYDRRILGDAQLRLEYAAQSPDLLVEGSIDAEAQSVEEITGPALVPEGARTVDPNALFLSGRIRLPPWARAGSPDQASALPPDETLDLSVDVERADLFFFRYIFEERISKVRGYVTGPLRIRGRLQDPRFEADFEIVNGAVRLPLFGLAYRVEGPVEVDQRGIHARTLQVTDDEGSATINGSVLFNDYQYFSFDLSASLEGITVIDVSQAKDLPFYGYIRGSGPLELTGPLPDATLRSNSARTTPDSELYIPVSGRTVEEDTGFIVFTDSTGQTPSVSQLTRRPNILADRPEGVPSFVEGLNLDFNVVAPDESTVNLVFDPLVGDVVTVVGSGRVQLQRQEGEFSVYGNFNATSGTYLFTAGEVFVRRFAINEGTITWDGSPTNAQLNLDAEYRTRASPSGLPGFDGFQGRIPVTVQLAITGRVASPQVDLSLSMSRSEERNLIGSETLDAILNQPARTTEYATSVLLTNTFLLTTESITQNGGPGAGEGNNQLTTAGNQLAFNSVSQLVSSQLNRYLGEALPNVDLNFGVQGEDPSDLDLIYGVALRLLNERLVIRGEGVYTNDDPETQQAEGPQGEFVVEVRLSPSVSAKVFYRRTGDELTQNRALTSSRGAGVSYQTQFSTWRALVTRLFGWIWAAEPPSNEPSPPPPPVARDSLAPADSISARRSEQESVFPNDPV
jgi:hypothetical protein